jgi:phosphoribosyl-AMP cyclohydrolase
MKIKDLKFDANGLIPVAVQEVDTGEVLLIGFANEEALRTTFSKKLATLWSRSRNELWTKGDTSGNRLHLDEVRYNCEENTLLYRVRLEGDAACHTGNYSCFFRELEAE